MFCKRTKKEHPPETFITTPARVMAILQLCLAFTIIAWHAGKPFAGDLYAAKSKLVIYQHVIGTKNPQHAARFEQLPKPEQEQILNDYAALLNQIDQPYVDKLKKSFAHLFFETPMTEMGWLALSIVIPILLLKRVEGSVQAVWLLPLAMLCLTIDNRWHGTPPPRQADEHVFPSEDYIIQHYLKQPLSRNIIEQHTQLSQGWESYLIHEWAHEEPSQDLEVYQQQKVKGDFAFQLARLEFVKPATTQKAGQIKQSYYFLGLGLFWHLSFAMVVWSLLSKKQEHSDACKISH